MLTYRGVNYQYNFQRRAAIELPTELKYRGRKYSKKISRNISLLAPRQQKYRGQRVNLASRSRPKYQNLTGASSHA